MQVHIPMHSVGPVGSVTVWLKTVIKYDRNIMSNEVRAVKLSMRVVAELASPFCASHGRNEWPAAARRSDAGAVGQNAYYGERDHPAANVDRFIAVPQ